MRIRLESEAVALILERCERGEYEHVAAEIARIEIAAMPDAERKARVQLLLPKESAILELTESEFERARFLATLGFKPADALHIAAAEALQAGVLLSCDDWLCRLARRRRRNLKVIVANPLDWLKESIHGPNP
jgi:predicted nucleic acid-binding protein